MFGERRAIYKEFKLMSIELSNSRADLGALAKNQTIHQRSYTSGVESYLQNRITVLLEMER